MGKRLKQGVEETCEGGSPEEEAWAAYRSEIQSPFSGFMHQKKNPDSKIINN